MSVLLVALSACLQLASNAPVNSDSVYQKDIDILLSLSEGAQQELMKAYQLADEGDFPSAEKRVRRVAYVDAEGTSSDKIRLYRSIIIDVVWRSGRYQLKRGQLSEAIRIFRTGLDIDERNKAFQNQLVVALVQAVGLMHIQGRCDQAEPFLAILSHWEDMGLTGALRNRCQRTMVVAQR